MKKFLNNLSFGADVVLSVLALTYKINAHNVSKKLDRNPDSRVAMANYICTIRRASVVVGSKIGTYLTAISIHI